MGEAIGENGDGDFREASQGAPGGYSEANISSKGKPVKGAQSETFPWSIKQIHGALRSCIAAHGPITVERANSAAKRIVNQLYGASLPSRTIERLEASARRERRMMTERDAAWEDNERLRRALAHLLLCVRVGDDFHDNANTNIGKRIKLGTDALGTTDLSEWAGEDIDEVLDATQDAHI